MFATAIARSKGDQPGGFGIGERHARLGDAIESGGCCIALEHRCGFDRRDALRARLRLLRREARKRRAEARRARQSDRGERRAVSNDRLGGQP